MTVLVVVVCHYILSISTPILLIHGAPGNSCHTQYVSTLIFGLNRWKTASFTAQQRGKAALSVNESFIFKQPIRLERIGVNWLKVASIARD